MDGLKHANLTFTKEDADKIIIAASKMGFNGKAALSSSISFILDNAVMNYCR